MTSSQVSSTRSNSKDHPLVFVSTSTAVFSEASRTAARSHAAAWSRRRLKEAKAKPKPNQALETGTNNGSSSSDHKFASPFDKLPLRTWRHNSDEAKEATGQSIRGQPEQQLNLSFRSHGSDAKLRNLRRENLIRKGNRSNLSLAVCGKNGFLDPFDSLAVKVDSTTYGLLQFYGNSPAMAWDSQPYAPNHGLSSNNDSIVSNCMSSKLDFYAFLSLSAALMEAVGVAEVTLARATLYSQLALVEIQIQLRNEKVDQRELLHGVSTLSIAAALQGNAFAARAHLQAAKYLVERLGGFEGLQPLTAQRIRYGDFHLAIETLSPPIFPLDFEPDGFPGQEYEPDPVLKQMRENTPQISQNRLSPCLFENLRRLVQCAEVLEGIWAQANSSCMKDVEWLASKIGSSMNRLLSTTVQTTGDRETDNAQEATKIILILWNLVTLMFGKSIIADTPLRSSMPIFTRPALKAMRTHWPPWIYLGLMSWNEIVRSPSVKVEDRGTFWSLINVVRSMEAEGLVRLADLMDRLYQLEDTFRLRKRQPETLEYALG